jgi:sporulation protein YlmC with PRC-barrel domain
LVSVSRLVGKKVIGSNAYVLGEITGADVDTEKWLVTHLHVGLTDEATRELGFRKPAPRLCSRLFTDKHHPSDGRCDFA